MPFLFTECFVRSKPNSRLNPWCAALREHQKVSSPQVNPGTNSKTEADWEDGVYGESPGESGKDGGTGGVSK